MSLNQSLAFVFPGQGSQKIGMLADMAAVYPVIEQTFAEATQVLGYDLWDMVQNGNEDSINLTERTQPILLTASVALWRIWQQKGGAQPAVLAGHSLGEWSALVCADVVDFADAVNVVRLRGAYMQEAVAPGQGAMAAIIGLDDDSIASCCERAGLGEEVAAVNFNAPGQVVIAGVASAVDRAIVLCKEAGAKRAMPLAVSAPFHTRMMKPAADKLAADLSRVTFNPPRIPIVHNVHGQPEANPDTIRELMLEQIYSSVRWVDCVQQLVKLGARKAVECGPGKVLCGLNKRIEKSLQTLSTDSLSSLDEALGAA